MKAAVFIGIFTILFSLGYSQAPKKIKISDPEEAAAKANEHFKHHNYLMALPIYLQLLQLEPDNTTYNYNVAVCYVNTHINRTAAIPYLEKALKDPKVNVEAWFLLGKSYHLMHKFDEAIENYQKFKELNLKHKEEVARAELAIDQVNHARLLVKHPVNVTFTNLGPEINTEFPDFYPWVTADETTLFFTSRRKGGHTNMVESDGYYSSDIFMSADVNGKWEKAKNLPGAGINTSLDEQVVGIRSDGGELIVYIDHIKEYGDLYATVKKNNGYGKLEKYNANVNGELEFSGSITTDDQTLFFVRKGKDGVGGQDIYMCKRLPNGQWALPQNLGTTINTPYNEDFPYLSMDGQTLFFASEGHSSMGGYDLFKSTWDQENNTWSQPTNLGYPINTADDELNISILPDNRAGYLSAVRKEGFGDLDIYRVKFEDNEQLFSIFRGKVNRTDSTVQKDVVYHISAINKKTQDEYSFAPSPITGKYIIALQAGVYEITVSADGYEDFTDVIVVYDIGGIRPEVIKDYVLKKQ